MPSRGNCADRTFGGGVRQASIGAGSERLHGVTPQNLRGVSGRAYIPKLGVFRDIATTSAHHMPHYYSTSGALAAEC